jgi:hypothetical protein
MLTAKAYIAAVEAADGQSLESGVKSAFTDFIVGCHSDGILSAIKASCILAGARTLSGALVPLAGSAPTNFNFVSADYNRKTGLKGNGTTKRLSPSRNGNSDPQNNCHLSAFRGESITATHNAVFIGSNPQSSSSGTILRNIHLVGASDGFYFKIRNLVENSINSFTGDAGFQAVSRNSSTFFSYRAPNNQSGTFSVTSVTPNGSAIGVFCAVSSGSPSAFSNNRLSFYSIGEALDLSKLDTRVSTLMTALAAAI